MSQDSLLLGKNQARRILVTLLAGGLLTFLVVTQARAQNNEEIVHIFGTGGGIDGADPYGGVVLDSAGNLYGTANYGGSHHLGLVWKMSRGANGQWSETPIYNFGDANDDGSYGPLSGLVFDQVGNLYGTTIGGGQPSGQAGTVFELSPGATGKWLYKHIHSFGGVEGQQPRSAVIFDSVGNLYGNTSENGLYNEGTVFKLARGSGGVWQEETLYSFGANPGDATGANQSVVIDSSGNIWGTIYVGGAYGLGAIYELTPNSIGGWTETIIHSFAGGSDGAYPQCTLTFDANGNLYGTVGYEGPSGDGYVYELSPASGGGWTMTMIYDLAGVEGRGAYGKLTFDTAGNLYGATLDGGAYGEGNVFVLKRAPGGTWTGKNLHSLRGGVQGCEVDGGVSLDSAGNLYGTTLYCGNGEGVYGSGMVFEIIPAH